MFQKNTEFRWVTHVQALHLGGPKKSWIAEISGKNLPDKNKTTPVILTWTIK